MPWSPPLSDRALKYGRNVMATSGVIVVLAWVPEIDVERFQPFGFDVSVGGALSIWGVLCAVLVYYFASFIFDSCIDIPAWRREREVDLTQLQRAFAAKRDAVSGDHASVIHNQRGLRYSRWRMWFDIGAPTAMFIAAMTAAIARIAELWPSGANGV